jgi:hypothetical protein
MNIIMLLRWSLGRGNRVVPSRWQATGGFSAREALRAHQVPTVQATKQATPTAPARSALLSLAAGSTAN